MLRGVSDLRRLTISATDGNLGSLVDLCFDDRSWAIRYLVVDAGSWLPDRRVRISPRSVRPWAPDPRILRGALSKREVELSAEALVPDARPEAHLQVATAAIGYTMQTEDGTIGHVQDVLVDDRAWAIRYLLVATTNKWVGKRVLVAPEWLSHVSWDESKTFTCIATAVTDSPANGTTRLRHASRAVGM